MSNLARYSTQDLFEDMRREMQEMMNSFFGRPVWPVLPAWPRTDRFFTPIELKETDSEYLLRMDIPGVSEKDIQVTCQGDVLTVKGERKSEKAEDRGGVRYSERAYGSFQRTIELPSAIKHEGIRARYKDGVLEVTIPKAAKTPTQEIKVEVAG